MFVIGRLNHIGIAVPDIAAAIGDYRRLYGARDITPIRDMPEQGVRVAFVNLENTQIELIEPLGEESPIRAFLARNPKGGQHHICFEVANLHEAQADLAAQGATILGKPRIGAHGTLMVFVHPRDFHGVLIELMEPPAMSAH